MKRYVIVFLCILLVTSLMVGGAGYAVRHYLLEPFGIEREEHTMALPFVLLADEILQFQVRRGWEKATAPETEPPVTQPPTEPEVIPTSAPDETQPSEPTQPTETEPVYTPVDESWFDDALFIGDSRSFGLKGMGRLGKADYFCAGSITVFGVMDVWLSDWNFPETDLAGLLQSKTYGKIYIHLGLNELVAGADAVMEGYKILVDFVRGYQPDAVIVIQSCMTMTEWMGSGKNFPIDQLHKLNGMLKELAESDPEVFRFCDTNAWAAKEDGYIRDEIACDGCHLYGACYTEWAQFILEDAGWYGIP